MASEWYYDEGYDDPDRDPDDEWACEFGARCLMPSFIHRRSECYTVEMAQAWQDEEETAALATEKGGDTNGA